MRVAIIGAGGVGRGTAALLARNGHAVALWSPRGASTAAFRAGAKLRATGAVDLETALDAPTSCADALAGADAVLFALPGNGHRAAMEAVAPHLTAAQAVIVSSHCSLGALFLSRLLAARARSIPIIGWGTTVVMAQAAGPDGVRIAGIRQKLDAATLPAARADDGLALCRALFGDRFEPREDMLAIALSNLNPPNHMANALCNFTRMENGEAWGNYGGMTPAVCRLIEALDAERLAVAAAFGKRVRTAQQHFALSSGLPPDLPVADLTRMVHERRPDALGPKSLDTRWITEDVPFGLVPLAATARLAGVKVPLHDAGIALFSALYGRDFAAENDLLPALDLAGFDAAHFQAMMRDGWPQEESP